MGRSRGGLTTKIHAVVDANGNPIALKLSEGQAHDGRSAADMLDSVGPGQTLLAARRQIADGHLVDHVLPQRRHHLLGHRLNSCQLDCTNTQS
jgi:transposase